MKKALCLNCLVIALDHNKHQWRICNKQALPIAGAKMNFDKCMANGGYKAPFVSSSGVMQQGEGRFYPSTKQLS